MMSERSILAIGSWAYLQEGNQNVVLSYVGPDPALENYVLRVPKSHSETKAEQMRVFKDVVASSLLDKRYLPEQSQIVLSSDFLSALDTKILPQRPAHRTHKGIAVACQYAILTQNLLKIPSSRLTSPSKTFSVEIKPKWGFLPTSPYISSDNEVKRKHCRFCMYQHLKNADPADLSGYCPISLYSLDREKIREAVVNLMKTPQNNLRFFVDGKQCSIAEVVDRTGELFGVQDSTFIAELISKTLIEDQILQQLKELQRDLDLYDIEGIATLYPNLNEILNEPTEAEWAEMINDFLSDNERVAEPDPTRLSEERKRLILHRFLAAATFKDCSILISYATSPTELSENSLEPVAHLPLKELVLDQTFSNQSAPKSLRYQIGVVDLDPKSITKLTKYHELDQDIVKNFIQRHDPQHF